MKRLDAFLAAPAFMSLLVTACAPKRTYAPTPVPGWEYVRNEFPEPPSDLPPRDQSTFERGWRALIDDDLDQAAEDLEKLGRRHGQNASVSSALGYLELRSGNRRGAEDRFASALKKAPSLAPAQAGLVLIAMAEGDEEGTFDRLRGLKNDHPDHLLVRGYLSTLQLKLAESKLQAARSYRNQERYKEAAEMYRQALRIAPEAGGLFAEAAEVELLGGEPEEAAAHAARALELEPESARLYRLRGDALRQMDQLEDAIEAYEKARALRPEDYSLSLLIAETQRKLRRESLPPEFQAISQSERITREELAALLYVRLRPALEKTRTNVNVIATDIGDSWAAELIRQIVGAGIMDIRPNHTFQPKAFVRRSELAAALVDAWDSFAGPEGADSIPEIIIQDVSPENLNYRSAALTVALGLMSTDSEGRFEPLRFVRGREAVEAVDALARRLIP